MSEQTARDNTDDDTSPECLGSIEDANLCVHLHLGEAVILIQDNESEGKEPDCIVLNTREQVQSLITLLVESIPFVPPDSDDTCLCPGCAVKAAEELLEP